ncbi:putative integral membrane protein [Cryptosporidium felis]|nr:putative integral membrane protein [Cryptosporidium felis]
MSINTKNNFRYSQNEPGSKTLDEKYAKKVGIGTLIKRFSFRKLIKKYSHLFIISLLVLFASYYIYLNKEIFKDFLTHKINFLYEGNLNYFQIIKEISMKIYIECEKLIKILNIKLIHSLNSIYLFSMKVEHNLKSRLTIGFIWFKYKVNVSLLNIKYEYKRLLRTYKILAVIQVIIYRIFNTIRNFIIDITRILSDQVINSSNQRFYFALTCALVILAIIWDNIVMMGSFQDYRLNNLKIVTSTISSLITMLYLSNIQKYAEKLYSKYNQYTYDFCSRAFLQSNIYNEFEDQDPREFTFISDHWWKTGKFESIFKGVEIINEIKRRSQVDISTEMSQDTSLFDLDIIRKVKQVSILKEICKVAINGNERIRLILRITMLILTTGTVFFVLINEKMKLKSKRSNYSYSTPYILITVISGLMIPLLLNCVQKFTSYNEQGRVISILLFLSIKLITNHSHFLNLVIELINNIKSKFQYKNNFGKILLPDQGKHSITEESRRIESNETNLSQVSESSPMYKERNRKTSLLFKSKMNSNLRAEDNKMNNLKRPSNQRSHTKELNRNKIKHLNDVIKNKITTTNNIPEKFKIAEPNLESDESNLNLIIKCVEIIKKTMDSIKNIIYKMVIKKVFGSLLFIFFKEYRGSVLSSFDHYKLDHYFNESKLPVNIKEELLRSMTLCYSNIGNPQIIRSITISKEDLIKDLENFKFVLPDPILLDKLKEIQDQSSLSQIEIVIQPLSTLVSLEDKINTEIQYYKVLNSIQTLSNHCEVMKESCKAIINSESLIEMINNITNRDLEKITLLLNSNMDYEIISDIVKSVVLVNENKSNIWNKFSLITGSLNKVNSELVNQLKKLKDIEIREIFVQWNILRNGLKYVLNQVKNNRRSYEDIYMGGLPLHTLQMALHHLNTLARRTSDLVQESIIACCEFCLYFNLKTIQELQELNKTSIGQSKLFELCKKDCIDILQLIQTIQEVIENICEQKIRIDGKEIDISYLSSSMLPPVTVNSEHKCCKRVESNCKLHGKGLQDTFRLYAEGNYPAVIDSNQSSYQTKKDSSKFIPERPRSSIPRESTNHRDHHSNLNEEKTCNNHTNESLVFQTSLRLPKGISKDGRDSHEKNNEKLPFLLSTPDEVTQN